MSPRKILVLDRDDTALRGLADSFATAGYEVETAACMADVCRSVSEQHTPVILLGNGCGNRSTTASLVAQLKRWNPGVAVILVSDEESLPTIRSIREEGIFYHALKPTSQEDAAEILSAVACAFSRPEDTRPPRPAPADCREAAPPRAAEDPPVLHCLPAEEGTGAALSLRAEKGEQGEGREEAPELDPTPRAAAREWAYRKDRTLARGALVATSLAAGAAWAYFLYTAATRVTGNGDFMMWCFLGFVSLLIVSQAVPAFFLAREAKKVVAKQLQKELREKQAERAPSDR